MADEADEPVVRCSKCLTLLAEPPNTPPEKRVPCPKCGGALARTYAITLSARVVTDVVTQPPPAEATASAPTAEVAVAKLADAHYSLQWLRLSGGGAWMLRVFDPDGDFRDGAISDDPQEALLGVAERLLP
jgi:hypothetical protein